MDVNKRDIKQTRFSVRLEKRQVRRKPAESGRILTAELSQRHDRAGVCREPQVHVHIEVLSPDATFRWV